MKLRAASFAAVALCACRAPESARREREHAGTVVCEHRLAAEVGARVLERGGNAADAAVATALALAVVYPQAGNLGGGGFALWCSAGGEALALDFRETAPASADPKRYLDERGRPQAHLLRASVLAVGVPGSAAGLCELLQRCGSHRFSLRELAQPAIGLAERGFEVDAVLARDLRDEENRERLEQNAGAAELFYPEGEPLAEGDWLVQPELAATLRRFGEGGAAAFYGGDTARALLDELDASAQLLPEGELWDAGWIEAADLASYRAKWREPLRGEFRDRELICMPPPSSGGVILLQTLRALERCSLDQRRADALARHRRDALSCGLDADVAHLWIEVLRRSFRERAETMGDPDFRPVPVESQLSEEWLRRCLDSIGERASDLPPSAEPREGSNTTHLSVLDRDGNAIALTTTLNSGFGSGILVRGAGFLLNDELDDFAFGSGARNQFGLVGGEANALAPGKRPLSSMTPTIVRADGRIEFVLGSPGGPRIITAVIGVLLRAMVYEQSLDEAVAAPRLHQQWSPVATLVEPGWPEPFLEALRARGHTLEVRKKRWASVQAIRVHGDGHVEGVSDPRRGGTVVRAEE